eukprot:scaffold11316_cov112-Isochrysis_galbana.AAC.1
MDWTSTGAAQTGCVDRPSIGGAAVSSALTHGDCRHPSHFSGCGGSSSAHASSAECRVATGVDPLASGARSHKLRFPISAGLARSTPPQNDDEVLLVKKQLSTLLLLNCRERAFRQRERAGQAVARGLPPPDAACASGARYAQATSRVAKGCHSAPAGHEQPPKRGRWAREEPSAAGAGRRHAMAPLAAPTAPANAGRERPMSTASEAPAAASPASPAGGLHAVLATMSPDGMVLKHNSAHIAVAYHIFRQMRRARGEYGAHGDARAPPQRPPIGLAAADPGAPGAAACGCRSSVPVVFGHRSAEAPPTHSFQPVAGALLSVHQRPGPPAPAHEINGCNPAPGQAVMHGMHQLTPTSTPLPTSSSQLHLKQQLSEQQYYVQSMLSQQQYSAPGHSHAQHFSPRPRSPPLPHAQQMQTSLMPMPLQHQGYGHPPQVRTYHPQQPGHMPHHHHGLPPPVRVDPRCPPPPAAAASGPAHSPMLPALAALQMPSALPTPRLHYRQALAQARALCGRPGAPDALPSSAMPLAYLGVHGLQPFQQMGVIPRVGQPVEAQAGGPPAPGAAGSHGLLSAMRFY